MKSMIIKLFSFFALCILIESCSNCEQCTLKGRDPFSKKFIEVEYPEECGKERQKLIEDSCRKEVSFLEDGECVCVSL